MRTTQTTYRYRIEPTAAQEVQLRRFAGARRWVWNWALVRKQEHYKATKQSLSYQDLAAELVQLKRQPETAWLAEIDSQLLQQVLRDLDQAFKSFFAKRSKRPKFKSKKTDRARFRIPQRVVLEGSFVRIPKLGLVRVRLHRPLIGISKSATFVREPDGHWYVSFVVEQILPDRTERPVKQAIGVDLGLKIFLVGSDGRQTGNPRYYRTQLRKLKRAQRALSRKRPGSANRQKARLKVARLHQKIKYQRLDFLHQETARLVQEHDLIAIEDLSVRGLAKTKLSTSVLDAGWGTFRQFLSYKADRQDKHLIVIGRFYPSSRLCGLCGAINANLTLADRVWTCACGATHDRDLNAAQNILAEGLRIYHHNVAVGHTETQNACRASVSPVLATGVGR
jgi:putative transposase